MTEKEFKLTAKNLRQWTAFIEKVQRKAKAAERELTDDETENLNMRSAQCVVWVYLLKQAEKRGITPDAPVAEGDGDMSVNSEVVTGETAVATE